MCVSYTRALPPPLAMSNTRRGERPRDFEQLSPQLRLVKHERPVCLSTFEVKMSTKVTTPHASAMDSNLDDDLPYVSRFSKTLETNEYWRKATLDYLKDGNLLDGIRSLGLENNQTLEDARSFIRRNDPKILQNLTNRAASLDVPDFESKSANLGPRADFRTHMWNKMAIMVCQVAQKRRAKPKHKDEFSMLFPFRHHCQVLTMLLFDILASAESPPDDFLRDKFLPHITVPGEQRQEKRIYRKRKVLDSSDEEEEENEEPSSNLKKSLSTSARLGKRSKPGVQSDDDSDSLFVSQKDAVSEAPNLPLDDAFSGLEQSSVFPAESSVQPEAREVSPMTGGLMGQTIIGRCLTCPEKIPSGPFGSNVQCAACKNANSVPPKCHSSVRGSSKRQSAETGSSCRNGCPSCDGCPKFLGQPGRSSDGKPASRDPRRRAWSLAS
jgi:hypothetical protein